MESQLLNTVKKAKNIKYIFCDYYDTIIHRTVHPLKPFKIWAKSMKQEFNLTISNNDLYTMRRTIMRSLCKSLQVAESEVDYKAVMLEIYNKLEYLENINSRVSFDKFLEQAIEADYNAEINVQYVNKKTIADIAELHLLGYKVYCVSDFHADENMILRLMKFHNINQYYDKIFVSASQKASKENNGLLFKTILEKEKISPNEVLMIGDNPISDIANAEIHGITSFYLKRYSKKIKQKMQYGFFSLGNKLSS